MTESLLWGVIIGAAIGAGFASYVARDMDPFEWEHPSTPLGLMVADLLYVPVIMLLLGWPAGWLVGLPKPWLVALVAAGVSLALGWLGQVLNADDAAVRIWPLAAVVRSAIAYAVPAAAVGEDADLPAGPAHAAWMVGVLVALLIGSRLVQRTMWMRSKLRRIGDGETPILVPEVPGRKLIAVGKAHHDGRLILIFKGTDNSSVRVCLEPIPSTSPPVMGWNPPDQHATTRIACEPDGDSRWISRRFVGRTYVFTIHEGTLIALEGESNFVTADELRAVASLPVCQTTVRPLLRRLVRQELPWW